MPAEDAVQETYIKAMRSYATFEKKSSEKTWITRIAINCCKNVIRTHWFKIRQNASGEQLQMQHHNPIDDFLEKDSLSGAIMKLNKLDKTVIILFYYQELPVKEIAMIINKTENATLQCLRRARIKLKEILKEDGYVSKNYSSYDAIQSELNIELLDTTLFEENDWMHGNVYIDNTDFMIIKLENYILEDMENYSYDSAEGYYRYYNAISLEINIILSEEQLAYGWDTEYLGLYQFVENYISEQGYKVNLLEDTLEEKKCAVFVADGIQYTLKGRVSEDTMKEIVDSMMY